MMKLLIADSGATKTDWALIQEGKPVYVRSEGLHPFYLDRDRSARELKTLFSTFQPDLIRFYGAGCFSEEAAQPVLELLRERFGNVAIEIHDDLHAAAHAFLPRGQGVVAILGTGSASGQFRDGKLIHRIPSLGYVLGDEGSAADIGKRILRSFLREDLNPETARYMELKLGYPEYQKLISGLYRDVRPSYYLSEVTRKAFRDKEPPVEVRELAQESFRSFVKEHLYRYEGLRRKPVVLAGGIASALKTELEDVLEETGIREYTICGSVITGLAERGLQENP